MISSAIAVAATCLIASPSLGQDSSSPTKQVIGYRHGKPITKDTPPPNKKPPNVHEVREAAGYDPTTNSNPIATSSDLPICCGIPVLVLFTSPIWLAFLGGWFAVFNHHTPSNEELSFNRERIRILEEKARKGDLVAFQQWKEATGRVGSNDMTYSYFMVWW